MNQRWWDCWGQIGRNVFKIPLEEFMAISISSEALMTFSESINLSGLRRLFPATCGDMLVPRTRTITYGPRSCRFVTWNNLSVILHASCTTRQFQSGLKTILLHSAYEALGWLFTSLDCCLIKIVTQYLDCDWCAVIICVWNDSCQVRCRECSSTRIFNTTLLCVSTRQPPDASSLGCNTLYVKVSSLLAVK